MNGKIIGNKTFLKRTTGFLLSLWIVTSGFAVFAQERMLVPVGQTVGVTLTMDGVAIVDTGEFQDYDGKSHAPARDAGIKSGDIIQSINGIEMESASQLETMVNEQGDGELTVTLRRDGEEKELCVHPALSASEDCYRLGVWIRDAASGIGTVTYYDPQSGEFGALGHGIAQSDGQGILGITGGDILKSTIVSVQKGGKGHPGELMGVFADGKERLGTIRSNTEVGLKGVLDKGSSFETLCDAIPVASRDEAQEGPAEIFSNVEENRIQRFQVEIQKINRDETNTKGMVIHVTDQQLLEKTGGIVQGMSGSPIIQNGKLIGAVTHVFINDATRGYGIFMDNMMASA